MSDSTETAAASQLKAGDTIWDAAIGNWVQLDAVTEEWTRVNDSSIEMRHDVTLTLPGREPLPVRGEQKFVRRTGG